MTWPNEIKSNEFGLVKLDPEEPLRLEVRTWASVFGDGGSVRIDGFHSDGTRHYMDFGHIPVRDNQDASGARDHLQGVVDDFNRSLDENWRTLIENAREYVLHYWIEQLDRLTIDIANAQAGIWNREN